MHMSLMHCWRRHALSGVVRRWPWTVSTDAVQLVNCSKSQDRKQQSSCDQWLWLSTACQVCRRRPTAGVDVQWDERPAGRAQRDMGVLGPTDICWPASRSCIVSDGWLEASAVLEGSVWRGRIYVPCDHPRRVFWTPWSFWMTQSVTTISCIHGQAATNETELPQLKETWLAYKRTVSHTELSIEENTKVRHDWCSVTEGLRAGCNKHG